MKLPHISQKTLLFSSIVILMFAGIFLFGARDPIHRRTEQFMLKRQLDHQLAPLEESLANLGFTDLPAPTAECARPPKDPSVSSTTDTLTCIATVKKYIVVGSGQNVSTKLTLGAKQLSKQLDAEGWHQRADLRTMPWFESIARGVDYQPDQLNVKQLPDATCTIDFVTAFSKPKEPAITFVAACSKPKFLIPIE